MATGLNITRNKRPLGVLCGDKRLRREDRLQQCSSTALSIALEMESVEGFGWLHMPTRSDRILLHTIQDEILPLYRAQGDLHISFNQAVDLLSGMDQLVPLVVCVVLFI